MMTSRLHCSRPLGDGAGHHDGHTAIRVKSLPCRWRQGRASARTKSPRAIGVGGMGEVYRARDTKLNRDVAIKILPEAFAHDPERLARFQREAQVLASLNHPNIAAIYGSRRSQRACRALVMELVEGEDLAAAHRARADPARRGAADREADRRGARSGARAGHHPSRSEAGEHQGARRRHGEGAGLRAGEGAGAVAAVVAERVDVADDHVAGDDAGAA